MRVLRFLFGNRYARAYLLVVAAVAVLVALVLWIARTPILPASDLLEGLRRAGEPLLTGWPRQGRRANPSLGQHDSVAAADGSAIDYRGVDADVYCVVLSGRPEDS